jgi:CxxC-x17-CxxC domain-containing protein
MGNFGNSSFRSDRNWDSPREMHKAKCSECGKDCEVPFKPSGDRPVYCKECFKKKNPYPKRF